MVPSDDRCSKSQELSCKRKNDAVLYSCSHKANYLTYPVSRVKNRKVLLGREHREPQIN